MNINNGKAIAGGVIGTAAMTVVAVYVAPMMGMPPMNPAVMLSEQMGGTIVAGWVAHFMIGAILAIVYAGVADRIPGAPPLLGAIFGIPLAFT
jgi:hypothetical protein